MTLPNDPAPLAGAYCNRSNLLLADFPISDTVDVNAYILAAAEEINLKIGQVWQVPVSVQDIPANYVTIRFLKRMNAHLATGRLLKALAVNIENDKVHAYATNLINEAQAALKDLVNGGFILPSLIPLLTPEADQLPILVTQQDVYSGVDSFYGSVMPSGLGAPPFDPRNLFWRSRL